MRGKSDFQKLSRILPSLIPIHSRSFHEIKDISLYQCAAECSSVPEECIGIVYGSLTNDCSLLNKTVADLGGKTLGLGGENMNFLRILKSIAQGIVLGLRYAHPTYMYICVLRKSFKIQSNYVTLLVFVSP